MTWIPGAREELSRSADWLHEQMRSLIAGLPGAGPEPEVRYPIGPAIVSWEDPLGFRYEGYARHEVPPDPGADLPGLVRNLLHAASWEVAERHHVGDPVNITARKNGCTLWVDVDRAEGAVTVTGLTPTMPLHQPRSADPVAPACPGCSHPLTYRRLHRSRNRQPGHPGPLRQEVWWECEGCGWIGYQQHEGEPLVPMHRLPSPDGDCPFCGEDEAEVESAATQDADGWFHSWVVCTACGTSNGRRYRSDR